MRNKAHSSQSNDQPLMEPCMPEASESMPKMTEAAGASLIIPASFSPLWRRLELPLSGSAAIVLVQPANAYAKVLHCTNPTSAQVCNIKLSTATEPQHHGRLVWEALAACLPVATCRFALHEILAPPRRHGGAARRGAAQKQHDGATSRRHYD